MKSLAVLEDKSLSIVEVVVPTYGEYEALVKIQACGVCNGTDIKLVHHAFKNFNTYPALLGHEAVGEIVAIGNKVRHLKIGDRVLLPFVGTEKEGYYSGWGGYSEYGTVGDAFALIEDGYEKDSDQFNECYLAQTVVPSSLALSPVEATMIITFREVLSAIKRFNIGTNQKVVIFGGGPVGLTFAKLLNLKGNMTIVFDITDQKVKRALDFGADYAFNSKTVDVKQTVWSIYKEGADFVIDAVGISYLINQAMELIKNCGTICCYGISPNLDMQLDWSKAPYNWKLDFVQWPSKKEEYEANDEILKYIEQEKLIPNKFISDVIAFEDSYQAFQMIEEQRTDLKTVIKI